MQREIKSDKLTPENIEKIINTYADRKTIDKYSHLANISEIKENDYNLNIPRYVDTFEPEPEIDLQAVTSEIKQLDKDMIEIDAKIAGFCDELGIERPF